MALQRLRNDPEAGWELRNRTPLWGPDFLMVSQDCTRGTSFTFGTASLSEPTVVKFRPHAIQLLGLALLTLAPTCYMCMYCPVVTGRRGAPLYSESLSQVRSGFTPVTSGPSKETSVPKHTD